MRLLIKQKYINAILLCSRRLHSIDVASFVDNFANIGIKRLGIVKRAVDGVAGSGRSGGMLGEVTREELAVDLGTEFRVVEQLKAVRHIVVENHRMIVRHICTSSDFVELHIVSRSGANFQVSIAHVHRSVHCFLGKPSATHT